MTNNIDMEKLKQQIKEEIKKDFYKENGFSPCGNCGTMAKIAPYPCDKMNPESKQPDRSTNWYFQCYGNKHWVCSSCVYNHQINYQCA